MPERPVGPVGPFGPVVCHLMAVLGQWVAKLVPINVVCWPLDWLVQGGKGWWRHQQLVLFGAIGPVGIPGGSIGVAWGQLVLLGSLGGNWGCLGTMAAVLLWSC